MSCDDNSCGTGGGNILLPGDPSNNGVLSVASAFGGIDVYWSFPTINPYAVAYTVLYRAPNSNFNNAILLVPQAGGGQYYDRVEPNVTYFYWIQFVSVNGTIGEVIGPASTFARSSIEKTIEELTGRIDSGLLAQSLKSEIAYIGTVDNNLIQEIQDRALADAALSDGVDQVQDVADLSIVAVVEETTKRETADAAMVDAINLAYAQAGGASAAIQEEAIVRASKDEALAQQITTAESTLNGNIAQVQTNLQTQITSTDGKVTEIGALYTAKVNVNGLIGGFGIYNDGTTVDAGFDVDTFWIGRTNSDKRKPFIVIGDEVFINQAIINELSVNKITSGNINSEWRMNGAGGRIVMDNGAVMKVVGVGFGANSDLIEWFGPSMPISECTKTNAKNYEAVDGSAYFGGALSAGTLYNAQQTTQVGSGVQVPVGPFWSTGNSKAIVTSFTYSRTLQHQGQGTDGYVADGSPTYVDLELSRSFNGGASVVVSSNRITGSYNIFNQDDGPDTATTTIGGSFTYTDTGGEGDYVLTARVVALSLVGITHQSGTSSTSIIRQNLGVVSIEV